VNFNDEEPLCVRTPTSLPPSVADVTESRCVPLTVTTVPTGPEAGVKPLIVGAKTTTRLLALVPLPLGVVTVTVLLVALAGTVTWMWVSSGTV
jgi:hypothetical protein